MPNYVMAALVIYTYTESSKLGNKSSEWIFFGSLRFVLQIMVYTFITKEFMDNKTYVVAILSVISWICFLTQGVVLAILSPNVTPTEAIQHNLRLIELGFNTGIVRSIM